MIAITTICSKKEDLSLICIRSFSLMPLYRLSWRIWTHGMRLDCIRGGNWKKKEEIALLHRRKRMSTWFFLRFVDFFNFFYFYDFFGFFWFFFIIHMILWRIYEGGPLDMAYKYGILVKTMWLTSFYSSIMPIGILFSIANLIFTYFLDKVQINFFIFFNFCNFCNFFIISSYSTWFSEDMLEPPSSLPISTVQWSNPLNTVPSSWLSVPSSSTASTSRSRRPEWSLILSQSVSPP